MKFNYIALGSSIALAVIILIAAFNADSRNAQFKHEERMKELEIIKACGGK